MIEILAIGKLKEAYIRDGVADYISRIARFGRVTVTELPEGVGDGAAAVAAESAAILGKLQKASDTHVVALSPGGREMDSLEFSRMLEARLSEGKGRVCFLIGGSEGLGADVLAAADVVLSFSRLTFPHQLFRLILVEQVYRALKIIHNQAYHK
jgi:23S rRNA (pseudouridine1915-N3)-methyltransferase